MRYGRTVTRLVPPADDATPWIVEASHGDGVERIEADQLWSTIPITVLAKLIGEGVPDAVHQAAAAMQYRGMLLVYLRLPVAQFTEFDAHYFPGANVRITRLSEPKNYGDLGQPEGGTVLCAELPSGPADAWWDWDEAALARLVAEDLATAGVPLPAEPIEVTVRRLPQAYPIYATGYERSVRECSTRGWRRCRAS